MKKHESDLDCEKQMFFGRRTDFPSCRFWPETENTYIFTLSRKLASLGAPWGEALAGVVVYANEVSRGGAWPRGLFLAP